MKLIEQLYHLLVNRVPEISMQYQIYRKKARGIKRGSAWLYLIKLNIQYFFGKRKWDAGSLICEKKTLHNCKSESALSKRESPETLAERLARYDVISFDVFDTLILRPFSRPADLFFLVGAELRYLDFERIRREAEQQAREKKRTQSGTGEATYEEIWEEMERETGIPKITGMTAEWECELRYCFANPYMLEVTGELARMGREFIVISDMYLGGRRIEELLRKNGITNFSECFVSCDYKKSKGDGSLYDLVRKKYGADSSYIHVGDNEYSDRIQALRHGMEAVYYKNVNDAGMKYRAEDMSAINGSVYRGLVNSYIHNGLKEYPPEYEYGFIYGGLFVLGYCQWIHETVRNGNIDKILFLSRDGDILKKVYQLLYPEECAEKKCEYVYWSRLAAAKMTAGYFKYDYFRRFLFHKINQGYVLKQIFLSMELGDMLEDFLEEHKRRGYTQESALTEKAAEDIRAYLQERWGKVLAHYEEQIEAGKIYYEKILDGCRKAAAVDVGWAGSGAVTLGHLVNDVWKLNCEITGLVAGTNSVYNHEPDTSEPLFYTHVLKSYGFSQEHNRDIWKAHDPNQGDNIIVELLLASEEKSFRGFTMGNERYIFSEKNAEINAKEVQRGIMDFVEYYLKRMGTVHSVSGRDAFAPVQVLAENRRWVQNIIAAENVTMNLD